MGQKNGEYDHIKRLETQIDKIEAKTDYHTQQLHKIVESQLALKGVEANTGVMATTLKDMYIDNREMVKVIGGKRQVPLSIFLIVVFCMAIVLVFSIARYTISEFGISTSGVMIKTRD